MSKATTDERDLVRISSAAGDTASLPDGAAKVLLQMLRAATEPQGAINGQSPLEA